MLAPTKDRRECWGSVESNKSLQRLYRQNNETTTKASAGEVEKWTNQMSVSLFLQGRRAGDGGAIRGSDGYRDTWDGRSVGCLAALV